MRNGIWKNILSTMFFVGSLCVVYGIFYPGAAPANPEPATVATTAPKAAASDTGNAAAAPPQLTLSDAMSMMGCMEVGCPIQAAETSDSPRSDPVGQWVAQHTVLVIGLLILFIASIWAFCAYAEKRDADKDKKQVLPDHVEINGVKHKLPTLKSKATLILPGDPRFATLSFDDIIGQEEAKKEVLEILEFLQNPKKFEKMEAKMPRGVMLFGAHGTGKTMLVRTIAALAGVPVLEMNGPEFVEMYVGVGASRARDVYEDADELVKIFGACIIFIDEGDAVMKARGGPGSNDERESTLNQILVEMDGVVPRPYVITFSATNRKDQMDPAALRPGRFDRQVEFFNPNRNERKLLIGKYLPERLRAADVDLEQAARGTPSASGAHLANIVNEAKILAARKDLDRVTQSILDEAVQKVMHGARRDSQRSVMHEDELDTVKVHEAGHALLYWLRTKKAPLRFTIIPRGNSGGHVEYSEDFEMMRTKEHLRTRLIVLMGGGVATFLERDGQEDTGIGSDYQVATQLGVQMVTVYGMSKLGKINVEELNKAGLLSDSMKNDIIIEVKALIDWAYETAMEMVTAHREDLKKLIVAVGEKETLLASDFEEVFIKPKRDEKVVPFQRPTGYRVAEAKPATRAAFGIPGFLRGWRRRDRGEAARKKATAE